MKYLIYIVSIIFITILAIVFFVKYNEITQKNQISPIGQLPSNLVPLDNLFSSSTEYSKKIDSIKFLKHVSLNNDIPEKNRVLAGSSVVSSFFSNGVELKDGFSSEEFNERSIYEYAKKINNINSGHSAILPLYVAYIGLRFYPEEYSKKQVLDLLETSKTASLSDISSRPCRNQSKVSSIIYMASKNKNTDITTEYGNYYSSFENTFNNICDSKSKSIVAFMWLAAISDVANTEKENKKAEELIEFIKNNLINDDSLTRNLKSSYFVKDKEPDTKSIVERISVKYPTFKDVLKDMENSISSN